MSRATWFRRQKKEKTMKTLIVIACLLISAPALADDIYGTETYNSSPYRGGVFDGESGGRVTVTPDGPNSAHYHGYDSRGFPISGEAHSYYSGPGGTYHSVDGDFRQRY